MYNTRTLELAQLNGAQSLLINVISYTCAFHVIMSAAKTFCSPHARSGCVTMMLKSNTSCKAVLYCPLWWKLSMMMSVMSQCPGVRLCVTAARWEMKSFEVSKNRHFMGVLNSFTVTSCSKFCLALVWPQFLSLCCYFAWAFLLWTLFLKVLCI